MRAVLVTLYEAVRGRFAIRELADTFPWEQVLLFPARYSRVQYFPVKCVHVCEAIAFIAYISKTFSPFKFNFLRRIDTWIMVRRHTVKNSLYLCRNDPPKFLLKLYVEFLVCQRVNLTSWDYGFLIFDIKLIFIF